MIALDCDIYMFCPKYQLPVSAILNDVLRAFVVNLLSRTLNFNKKKKRKEKKGCPMANFGPFSQGQPH